MTIRTRAELNSDADTNLPDNTTGDIGPDDVRGSVKNIADSMAMEIEEVFTITDGAGFAIDPRNGSIQSVTLGASRTPVAANWVSGDAIVLRVDDGTAFAITWSTIGVVWVGGSAPTLATSGWTWIVLWRVGATYYGKHIGNTAT